MPPKNSNVGDLIRQPMADTDGALLLVPLGASPKGEGYNSSLCYLILYYDTMKRTINANKIRRFSHGKPYYNFIPLILQ